MKDKNIIYAELSSPLQAKIDNWETDQWPTLNLYIKKYTLFRKKVKDRYGFIKEDEYTELLDREYKKIS